MEELLKKQRSLVISSLASDNTPEISYAPFIMLDNKIYDNEEYLVHNLNKNSLIKIDYYR